MPVKIYCEFDAIVQKHQPCFVVELRQWLLPSVDTSNPPLARRLFDALDLLGEITGGGYEELLPHSIRLRLYDVECFCLGLARLIHVKGAAGRPKDLETIAELQAILEERKPPAR